MTDSTPHPSSSSSSLFNSSSSSSSVHPLQSSTPRPHSNKNNSNSNPTLPTSSSSSSISSIVTSSPSLTRSPSLRSAAGFRDEVARIIASESTRRATLETEVRELRGKLETLEKFETLENFENFETLELPRVHDSDGLEDDLKRELEQVKRSKKEEIWKLNVEMSKLEKSFEETQIKSGSQIQRLELLLLFETNRAREATKKYEDVKEKFDKHMRLQENLSPDNESKYLREKLQSTELYCLEIEEQLERLKKEKSEWDLKFNGIAGELREATANEHEMLILLEEMQKEKSAAVEAFQREKSLRASAEEKITILQKQNEFFQRELRKASPSPPTTPPIPRSTTPPLASSLSSSISSLSPSLPSSLSASPPHSSLLLSKNTRNFFRFDMEWQTTSRTSEKSESLEIACVVCSSDGRSFREISNTNAEIFAAVQITNCGGLQGPGKGKRVELAVDKLGSDDLVFFVLRKIDHSSFNDVLQVKSDIFGYDNKKIGGFPIVNASGDHLSIVVGAVTRNQALSNFLCPNVTLEGEWKFYWMALKNNLTSNDQLFSLLRQQTQKDIIIGRSSIEKTNNDWVDPFVQSLGDFKREIADASERVSQQWVREDYEIQKHDDHSNLLHRGDTLQVGNNVLRLSWQVLPPYSGKIQSSCLIFDAFGRLMGDNNNSANNFGGGEGAIRFESPRVGRQETIIEFKQLPEQCGSMVVVMDTAFDGDDIPREIVCNLALGENGESVGMWRINMADLAAGKSDQPNRATAMILLSAPDNTNKGWKVSVVGQVLGGDIPLDGMVGYLENEIQKNKLMWASQALVAECRRSFVGLVRNVIGDEGEDDVVKRLEPDFREDVAPRLFPSMSSPAISPDPGSKSRHHDFPNPATSDHDDLIGRSNYEKTKRRLLKAEKRELKEALKKEKEKNLELEKEIQNLRSQMSPVSPPPTISITEDSFVPSLRRVKSQDPKEEGRLDANSDSLRKSKSYRKTSLSSNNLMVSSPSLKPPSSVPPSNTYSHNFQLKRTRALSPSLPERKPKPPAEPVAVEPAVVGSDVDDFLAEILERKQISGNIRKLEQGYFLIGTKRLAMQVLSGQLVVRVGGGFMNFEEWVRRFGRREGIIIGGEAPNNSSNNN